MSQQPINLILDSGAFSAWTKKTEINLDNYCNWCLENIDYIDYVVNLDVIPGSFGEKNLPQSEIDRSAKKGWGNYEYMLSKGIPKEKLIHIFHQGEDYKWLEKMVAAMDYIGLSPANDRTTNQKIDWLDSCMKYVTDDKGHPIVKFHGFAVTSLKLMMRYPWYSVDSTSWVMTSRMGSVYVPIFRNGEYVYDENSWKVCVSEKSPNVKDAGKHITTFAPQARNVICNYFKLKGFTLEELASDYMKRDELNIIYFNDLEKTFPEWPQCSYKGPKARSLF